MADDTTVQPQQVVILDPVSQTQKAISEAAAQAERNQLDEASDYPATQNPDGSLFAGGCYKVNGVWVNAEGKPVKAPKGAK